MKKEVKLKECSRHGCQNQFKPYLSTDKYCSYSCYRVDNENAVGFKKDGFIDRKTPIKPVSKKQSKRNAAYSKKRKEFLERPENKFCRCLPDMPATEIHHMKGRIGDLLLDENYWLPVCREAHKMIEENPNWAYHMGYSHLRLEKNKKIIDE